MTAPAQQQQQGLSAVQVAALIALIEAQARQRKQLTDTAKAAALAAFKGFTGWWSTADVDRAIRQVLSVVQPVQTQMARVTDAYIARVASTMTGRTVAPAGAVDVTRLRRAMSEQVARDLVDGRIEPAYVVLGEFDPSTGHVDRAPTIDKPAPLAIPDPSTTRTVTRSATRSGATSALRARAEEIREQARQQAQTIIAQQVRRAATREARRTTTPTPTATTTEVVSADGTIEPSDPYGRIADQYRYQVAAGDQPEEVARQKALVRVQAVAATDVTLAVREQVRRSLGRIPGITGYRRVVRPELTQTGPCGLCVVAADRLYKIEDLHPLHDRCVCEVLPVIGDFDPAPGLNASDLGRIYDAAGGNTRASLKRIRVALAEHGELGPVLVDADQHYRGPAEVARTRHPDPNVRARARLEAFEERLELLLRRQGRGEDVPERAIDWQSQRIDALRRELAGRR